MFKPILVPALHFHERQQKVCRRLCWKMKFAKHLSPQRVQRTAEVLSPKSLFMSKQYLSSEGWQYLKPHSCHILLPFCLTTTSALLWTSGCAGHTISYTGHRGQSPALRRRQRCSVRWFVMDPGAFHTTQHRQAGSEQESHFMHSQSLGAAFPLLTAGTCTWFLPIPY